MSGRSLVPEHELAPLDVWLHDPDVTEVLVNGEHEVWVERNGRLERAATLPDGRLDVLLERILAPTGRRLDRLCPVVDARLADGSRVCAAIPPVAVDGRCLAIRRFTTATLGLEAFAPPQVCELLVRLVESRCNVLVAGATSSGKTTLLNALAGHLPDHERIITLEDTAELALHTSHVLRLESRDATADGLAAIDVGALLRAALRLRPDRLVLGEIRGDEAFTLVQAMSTGHDGSMATLHASSTVDALRRVEVLSLLAAPAWPLSAIREQVHAAVAPVVLVGRGADGCRQVVEVAEVVADDATLTAAGGERLRLLARAGDIVDTPRRSRR